MQSSANANANANAIASGAGRHIADALAGAGYYVGESVLDASLTARLAMRARQLAVEGALQPARTGRGAGAATQSALRRDDTRWLDAESADVTERDAMHGVASLQADLNAALYVGARHAELHFARYAPGAFYRTHRDRFRDDDARVITLIFYLNDHWPADGGGELVLYADDGSGREVTRVRPSAGTMVCFRSEMFPHEVLPARAERLSLTGWLRRDERVMEGIAA